MEIQTIEFQKNILIEQIWQEAKNSMWQKEGIRKIAKLHNLTIKETTNMINFYFENTLKFNKKTIRKYKRYYKKYRSFIELKLTNPSDFDKAYTYYRKFASIDELESFKNVSLEILANVKINLSNITHYIASINLNLYSIYILSANFGESLTMELIKLFKPFFEFCNSHNWKYSEMKNQAEKENISYHEFKEMAMIYGTKILNIANLDEKIRKAQNKEVNYEFILAPIIEKILNSNNEEEYFMLFEKYPIRKEEIIRFCYTFNRQLSKEEKECMEQNLLQKLKQFQKNRRLKIAEAKPKSDILNEFLNSSNTLEEFCLINSYNIRSFRASLHNCQDEILIKKVRERLTLEQNARKKQKEETIIKIINCIKYGFTVNCVHYPFDFTSFFILFPSVNYKMINTGFLPKEEAQIIRNFFLPLEKMRPISKNIINAYINIQINDGKNTYNKEFTKDELTEIISFMEQSNIPLTDVLFHEVCLKYATEKLFIYTDDYISLK